MWDFVMAGLGLGLFVACVGYIRLCDALRDPQPEARSAGSTREERS